MEDRVPVNYSRDFWQERVRIRREEQGLNAEPPEALLERIGRLLGPYLTQPK